MDLTEHVRRRTKQMDLNIGSFRELADDLRIKRETGGSLSKNGGRMKSAMKYSLSSLAPCGNSK
jgi:hypothetical protein